MSARAPLAAAALLAAGALSGIVLLLSSGGGRGGAGRTAAPPGAVVATATARVATSSAADAVYDGPGAPRPDPALRPGAPGDPSAVRPEARERLEREAREWLRAAAEAVAARDWDALREGTAAARRDPRLFVELLSGEARAPRDALAAGLILEELVEDGTLDEAARARLARALVPPLSSGAGGALSGEERDHAMRLLSRFPGPESEEALLFVLEDPSSGPLARRHALFALAEAGSARALPAVRRAFEEPGDLETARVAALALSRIARRLGDEGLLREVAGTVAPRVASWLAPLLEAGDESGAEAVAASAAELLGLAPERFLATACLDAPHVPAPVKAWAIDQLILRRAISEAPALEARRGRLGDPALEEMLAAALEALRALERRE